MSITRKDANGNTIYNTDPSGNEIGPAGKNFAGVLLVVVTLLSVLVIIAHWPDKMPPNEGAGVSTKYKYKWFAVTYLGDNSKDTSLKTVNKTGEAESPESDTANKATAAIDTNQKAVTVNDQDSLDKQPATVVSPCKKSSKCTIDLNTLILLLVAMSGFLGNMIHIASSFTNFIGAGKFKRSWMLWYCVKPFTAAALAVGVYIIFRAGFLNSSEATSNVNLYGVVAIALLAGLFTDMATQKLKEIFGVVFQSSAVRPNPIDHPPLKITSIYPAKLPLNTETEVVVSGFGFDNRTLKLKINGEEITGADVQSNSIVFKYTATKEKPQLVIYDENSVEIIKYDLLTTGTDVAASSVTVTDITPASLTVNVATEITITGTGLDSAALTIRAGETEIDQASMTKTAGNIKFNYTAIVAEDIIFEVLDAEGNELITKTITVT